jgi:hypothetical protein
MTDVFNILVGKFGKKRPLGRCIDGRIGNWVRRCGLDASDLG